jgi:pyruvate dehydrogenase E2 component (dihydrolipoamide acetyltransferase)
MVPRLGWSMDEGTFVGWLKSDGEPVRPGEPLFSLETDKAIEQIEATDAGVLCIPPDCPKPGDKVTVGQVLAHLVAEGETVAATPASAASARPVAAATSVAPAAPARARRRVAVTPRARRAARELGLDWAGIRGSGKSGRIRERDVQAAGGKYDGRLIPHTNLRKTIAARMVAGVTQTAPVTLTRRVDATNLVALRARLRNENPVPGYTDLIVKLTAAALRRHPLLQAQWRDDGLLVPDRIDVAFAVDTDRGLLAPVVREADRLTLHEVAARTRELTTLARAGRLGAEAMRDATFTVSNLGGYGIDAFTPILHLPQCAVLGVGRIVREPAVVGDAIVPRDRLTLSLTFDHRVLDGAPAARFLATLAGLVEQPDPWLLP